MRLRIRSQRSTVVSTHKTFSGPTAPAVILAVVPRVVGSLDEMEDAPTKGYNSLSSSGRIINTPMVHRQSNYALMPKTWTQYSIATPTVPSYPTYLVENDMATIGEFSLSATHPYFSEVAVRLAALKTQVLTEAFARVGRADMEVLVTLAELPETIAFLKAPVEKGLRLVERAKAWRTYSDRVDAVNLRRKTKFSSLPLSVQNRRGPPTLVEKRPFRVGKFHATDPASFWLAVRYGLLPIMYDIQSLWKALHKDESRPARETVRSKATDDVILDKIASNSVSTYVDRKHAFKADFHLEVKAGVLYTPRTTTFESKYGLELHRLPAAAYEKIPLSFVTDWFHSASEYYDAITASCRSNAILAAWTSCKISYTITQTNTQTLKGGLRIDGKWSGETSAVETGTYKVREPASLSQTAPQLRLKLNAKRIVDGLALIHIFLSGRTKKPF